jgi:hypothetical protein
MMVNNKYLDDIQIKAYLEDTIGSLYVTDDERFKEMKFRDVLRDFMSTNRISIDLRKHPWDIVKRLDPEYAHQLKLAKTGHGFSRKKKVGGCSCSTSPASTTSFLTSDPSQLTKRLNILIAENLAGNNNVLGEVSAICDELRRKGLLSISTIKKIFSKLHHN